MRHTQRRTTDEYLHARESPTRIRFIKTVDTNQFEGCTMMRRILAAKEAINHLFNALFWV
jgi:hypothetical protein